MLRKWRTLFYVKDTFLIRRNDCSRELINCITSSSRKLLISKFFDEDKMQDLLLDGGWIQQTVSRSVEMIILFKRFNEHQARYFGLHRYLWKMFWFTKIDIT